MAKLSSRRRFLTAKVLGVFGVVLVVGIFLCSARENALSEVGQFLLVACPIAAFVVMIVHIFMSMQRPWATLGTCVLGGIIGAPVAATMTAAYLNAHPPPPEGPHGGDVPRFGEGLFRATLVLFVAPPIGFFVGFAVVLAICAWLQSKAGAAKPESKASDLE
jgi:hypothetical protein